MAAPNTTSADAPDRIERVAVLLPLPLAGPYDYAVPGGIAVRPGDFVEVPLSGRRVAGVVWGPAAGEVAAARLKPVERVLDVPAMPAVMRRFVDWVADYTIAPPGAVLRMAMSVPRALDPPKPVLAYAPGEATVESLGLRMTPARRRVLELLAEGPPRPARDLAREAGVGPSLVRGLAAAGVLREVRLPPKPPFAPPRPERPGLALSADQAAAAAALRARVGGGFSVTVLDGVTGSGKTEVYFEAVAAALAAGRQALVLLPEIALTAHFLDRFEARFGAPPAVWHSELGARARRETWRAVAEGTARVVVGARSALFLPFRELGLVVVDEEHDPAYKQEEGVAYHARDMAVVRGHLGGIPVVLVSATPSLETVANVDAGRYHRLRLPDRHGGATVPAVALVDLRREPPPRQCWLSPPLRTALAETVAAGEQALLFLNRRGYAPLTLCRACGHRLQCPQCTAWLVEHRFHRRLVCHHCGYARGVPDACPDCGAEAALAACGPGVERLEEEVRALLPEARIAVFSSDSFAGPAEAAALFERVGAGEIDILIGTQILAKGHHFPLLTLVGVVDADLGLQGGDLRAAERTFQLLSQVAGRAGRAERPGRVLVQTCEPEHRVMKALAAGDRERFLAVEAAERRRYGMPPFGRLAAVIVTGRDEAEVERVARNLGRSAPRGNGIQVFGPAPAPLAVLRGRHRRRLLVKAPRGTGLQKVLRRWRAAQGRTGSVRIQIDIDPYSFL